VIDVFVDELELGKLAFDGVEPTVTGIGWIEWVGRPSTRVARSQSSKGTNSDPTVDCQRRDLFTAVATSILHNVVNG
jgi:hypothetical protein